MKTDWSLLQRLDKGPETEDQRPETSDPSYFLKSRVAVKKATAFLTAFVFAWSMCVTPVMAETINLEGGSVDVNVQDNVTNWNVTGNPIWNMPEFNVAEGSIYNIAGLGSGSSLAVLVNGGSASNIFGTMNLFNLDFILQNIAGINIGSSAMINLNSASLIASTLPLNLSATDFLNRQYAFSGQGGFLMNEGKIIGDNANLVALVANAIENRGVIEVPMGTAALAAGDTVTVGISPDGMVTIGVDAATANELGLADQIKNNGTISAQGGRVVLNAKAIDGLFDKAIHIDASENATAVIVSDDGVIEFVAEGDITNTGTLQAKRGSITIDTTGDVETLGVLRAKTLTESAASFHIGGVYSVGSSSHDNLDNAITFSASTTLEGDEDGSAVDGIISDDENIIINDGVVLTLASDFTLAADADQNGTGEVQMAQTSEIVGGGYNLTLKASDSSTIGKVTGVDDLALYSQHGSATYQVRNAVTLTGNLTVNSNVTLTGGYSVTVGGGSVTGDGTINMTGGVFTVTGSGNFGGTTDWTFNELVFGDGENESETQKQGSNDITVVGELKIKDKHRLGAGLLSDGADIWNLSWAGGYLTDIVQIAAGAFHTLALTSAGKVLAWGENTYGNLGDGTTLNRSAPVEVLGLSHVSQIAAGYAHSLALIGNEDPVHAGEVRAWGYNFAGALGDGTSTNRLTPVTVIGVGESVGGLPLKGIIQIAAGAYHSMGLVGVGEEAGQVRTWGYNNYGVLGDGTGTSRLAPVAVVAVGEGAGGAPLTGVTQIAAGLAHSLALIGTGLDAGKVVSWGYNRYGQLGDGGTENSPTPRFVCGLSHVSQIAAGDHHSLALIGENDPEHFGEVRAWGLNNYGQLGDGLSHETDDLDGNDYSNLPVAVFGLSNIGQIIADRYHSLALITAGGEAGQVRAWGWNEQGQLGDGTLTNRSTPVSVIAPGAEVGGDPLTGVSQLASGYYHSSALTESGKVLSWGSSSSGQLGGGHLGMTKVPAYVLAGLGGVTLKDIAQVAGGGSHTLALSLRDGFVYAWGLNSSGALGNGTTEDSRTPVLVLSEDGNGYLSGVIQVAAGNGYSLALIGSGDHAGEVRAWGSNSWGALGDGTSVSRLIPTAVVGPGETFGGSPLRDVIQIAAGAAHSLALVETGEVLAWGYNYYGQLGDGTTTNRLSPVAVLGVGESFGGETLRDVVQIAAGWMHSLALIGGEGEDAGKVNAWGYNYYGQLGDGTTTDRLSPVAVLGVGESFGGEPLRDVVQIASGWFHSLALIGGEGEDAGKVNAWGRNNYGQLGDNDVSGEQSNVPVEVFGLTGIGQIVSGGYHSLALVESEADAGKVWAWGWNWYNQLGDGTIQERATPVMVLGLSDVSQIAAGQNHSLALSEGTVLAWGLNLYGQVGNNSANLRQITPDTVVQLSHAPFILEDGADFDAQESTFQYLGTYGFGRLIMTEIAEVDYYNLVLAGELVDYRMSSTLVPPTLEYLEGITGGKLTVLGQKREPEIDLEEAQAKFEEEMRRREEEAKNGGGDDMLLPHLRPDSRMQYYDPFRHPMNIDKLITDVRVREGAVYVVDRTSGMELLGQGESLRVNFKREDTAGTPAPVKSEEFDRSSGGYAMLVNPDKDVFVRCPGGEWQAARHDMVILPGDEVRTAPGAEAKVLLQGGDVGKVEVKGGSLFRITKAETDPQTGDKTTLLDLAIGKVLVHAQKLKGGSKFEVRTPTALTGVRGTTFTVEVKEKATA